MSHRRRGRDRGFTLIEILVVIAIIAVLAGLIVNLAPVVGEKKVRARAEALLAEIETAIEFYKNDVGYLPPDNMGMNKPNRPPLYYALTGMRPADDAAVEFLDREGNRFTSAQLTTEFGVPGFVSARDFYENLVPKHVQDEPNSGFKYLAIPATGPEGDFNPVNYDASSENRRNTDSYDLWVEVKIGGDTVTIGNW